MNDFLNYEKLNPGQDEVVFEVLRKAGGPFLYIKYEHFRPIFRNQY